MKKTKLGLSIGIVGAALCFLGCISTIPAFLLAGYVLLLEENVWLKKIAVRMMTVMILFSVAYAGVGLVDEAFAILNLCLGWLFNSTIRVPFNLTQILRYIISFLQDSILIIMGFKAFRLADLKSNFLDRIIERHMEA